MGVQHDHYPLEAARAKELLEGQLTPTEAAWKDHLGVHAAAVIALKLHRQSDARGKRTEPNKTGTDSCRYDFAPVSDTEWEALRVASGFPPRECRNAKDNYCTLL